MPIPLGHGQRAPGLVPLDSQPHPGQEDLSLELLSCFVMLEGPTSSRWRERGACGSDPSGGKPDQTKKGKRKMKSQQCPNPVSH